MKPITYTGSTIRATGANGHPAASQDARQTRQNAPRSTNGRRVDPQAASAEKTRQRPFKRVSAVDRRTTVAQRVAQEARVEAMHYAHQIGVINRVEAIRARVRLCEVPTVEERASYRVTDPNAKPVSYGMWKRFVEGLDKAYVKETLAERVQVYCVHCGMPTDVATAKPVVIGAIVKYTEDEVQFDKFAGEWTEEEKERIRPATHRALGCVPCQYAYAEVDNATKRLRYRVRYSVGKDKFRLYAESLQHAASLLQEKFGRVEILDCRQIPQRNGFLDVRHRVVGGI